MLPTGNSGVETIFLGMVRTTMGEPVGVRGSDCKVTGCCGGGCLGAAAGAAGGNLIIRWPAMPPPARARALGGSRIILWPIPVMYPEHVPGAPGARGVKLTAPIGVCWVRPALAGRNTERNGLPLPTPTGPL